MRYLFIIILLICTGCAATLPQMTADTRHLREERKPFRKSSVVLKSPEKHTNFELENPKFYHPNPRIVEIEKKAGKYELRWTGMDGKEKIIPYQRADAIDAVVAAWVEKTSDNRFLYKFRINNLPTSPTYFSKFVVQTFAIDVVPIKLEDVHNGTMSSYLRDFKEGVWKTFAIVGENTLDPGESTEFSLTSSIPPGIVGCRAVAGDTTLKGVGEDLPPELERAIPGSEEWASGYTIGPDQRLAELNGSGKLRYISDNLPKFLEAGWISAATAEKYAAILENQDLNQLFSEAKKDEERQLISSEVFHIVEGLNQ